MASYLPVPSPGTYTLRVRWGGFDVAGSPLVFIVQPGATSLENVAMLVPQTAFLYGGPADVDAPLYFAQDAAAAIPGTLYVSAAANNVIYLRLFDEYGNAQSLSDGSALDALAATPDTVAAALTDASGNSAAATAGYTTSYGGLHSLSFSATVSQTTYSAVFSVNGNSVSHCVGYAGITYSCNPLTIKVVPGHATTASVTSGALSSYPTVSSLNPGVLKESFFLVYATDGYGNMVSVPNEMGLPTRGLPMLTITSSPVPVNGTVSTESPVSSTFYGQMSDGKMLASAVCSVTGTYTLVMKMSVVTSASLGLAVTSTVTLSSALASFVVAAGSPNFALSSISGPGVSADLSVGSSAIITITASDAYGNPTKFTGSEAIPTAYNTLFRMSMTLLAKWPLSGFDVLTLASSTPILSSSAFTIGTSTTAVAPKYDSTSGTYQFAFSPLLAGSLTTTLVVCYNFGSLSCAPRAFGPFTVSAGAAATVGTANADSLGSVTVLRGAASPVLAYVADSRGNKLGGACGSLALTGSGLTVAAAASLGGGLCRFSVTGSNSGTVTATFTYSPLALKIDVKVIVSDSSPAAATSALLTGSVYSGAGAIAGAPAQLDALLLTGSAPTSGGMAGQTFAVSFTLGGTALPALTASVASNGDGTFSAQVG